MLSLWQAVAGRLAGSEPSTSLSVAQWSTNGLPLLVPFT